ncbi:MAG: DoxX family membrane protein [Polyangia bacterium]
MAAFSKENFVNLGLLLLRLGVGVNMTVLHGVDRVRNYSQLANSIPDPLGMGRRHSLMLVVAAEFVGGILVTLGLAGRLAALALAFSLSLTLFSGEAGLPWRQREATVLYLTASLAILLLGCGRWALDAVVWKRFRKGGGSAGPAKK